MFGELVRRDAEPLGIRHRLADAMIKQDQYSGGESLSDPPRNELGSYAVTNSHDAYCRSRVGAFEVRPTRCVGN